MSAFDVGSIDDVIHGRLRLGVMAHLVNAGVADFNELKTVLGATQGNLSVHLRKLEEAGYIEFSKSFVDRVPRTEYRLTRLGRQRLEAYLDHLEALIKVGRGS